MIATKLSIALFLALALQAFAQGPRRNGRGPDFTQPRTPRRSALAIITTADLSNVDPECDALTFRTIDGRCTSGISPDLAVAQGPQGSSLDVDSAVFLNLNLKSPREISTIVSDQSGLTSNSNRLNELFVFFGQFIDHDFAASPLNSAEEENIEIAADDVLAPLTVLEFTRSSRSPIVVGDPRERPITSLSSALDLTTVYGFDQMRNDFLRVENSCLLKTSAGNNLPFNTGGLSNEPTSGPEFYIAGDLRVTEQPVLTALHTVFLREHNRICGLLDGAAGLSLSASDSYNIARAINIGQFQKIVYEEFLPAIIGSRGLGRYSGYQPTVDPTISLEFTTAAFRFGHTMVGNGIPLINSIGVRLPIIPPEEMFFRASDLSGSDVGDLLRGSAGTRAQEVDTMVVDALRNILFRNVDDEEGIDLIALNLQRGRDHNVGSFNDLRQEFVGSRVTTFAQITSSAAMQQRLEEAYGSVDNIEAWPGLMAENKPAASGLGLTLRAMWLREFGRLRDGDFWFYLDNDRHNQIPVSVIDAIPEISRELFSSRPQFSAILLRNTDLSVSDIGTGTNVFRV